MKSYTHTLAALAVFAAAGMMLGCKRQTGTEPGMLQKAAEGAEEVATNVMHKTGEAAKTAAEKTSEVAKDVADGTKEVAKDVAAGTKEVTGKAMQATGEAMENAGTAVKDAGTKMVPEDK